MFWDASVICDAEGITLIKHLGALVFLLIFFSRWIPRKKQQIYGFQAEYHHDPHLVIADIVMGLVFSILLLVSVCLLLLPTREIWSGPKGPDQMIQGKVTEQWVRPYLWAPASAGTYGRIGDTVLYFPEILNSVTGNIKALYQDGNRYVIQMIGSMRIEDALQTPWYILVGRWTMILSGVYLAIRLGIVAGKEAVDHQRKWEKVKEKSDPVFRFLDRL